MVMMIFILIALILLIFCNLKLKQFILFTLDIYNRALKEKAQFYLTLEIRA